MEKIPFCGILYGCLREKVEMQKIFLHLFYMHRPMKRKYARHEAWCCAWAVQRAGEDKYPLLDCME